MEGLRLERRGGLGPDALAIIADARPRGVVVFSVNRSQQLVVAGSAGDGVAVAVDGPGFSTLDGRRDVPLAVPYPVALAIFNGARSGLVDVQWDDCCGFAWREEHNVWIQWTSG